MNDNEAMTDATVSTVGGNVIISDLHPTTGEGTEIIVPPAPFNLEVRFHYFNELLGKVAVYSRHYPTLAEAVAGIHSEAVAA